MQCVCVCVCVCITVGCNETLLAEGIAQPVGYLQGRTLQD